MLKERENRYFKICTNLLDMNTAFLIIILTVAITNGVDIIYFDKDYSCGNLRYSHFFLLLKIHLLC